MNREQSWLSRLPWGVIIVALMIPLVGAINLSSAAQATDPNLYLKQIAWLGLAVAGSVAVAAIHTSILEMLAYPIYVVVCGLLVLVLVAGVTIKGAQRWIDLGFFNLQPSELGKIAILIVAARYFGKYEVKDGYTLRMLLRPWNLSRPLGAAALLVARVFKQDRAADAARAAGEAVPDGDPTWALVVAALALIVWTAIAVFVLLREGVHHRLIIAPVDVVVIPFGLVLIEPDLGTSLIILAIAGIQILFVGVRKWSLIISTISGLIVVVFGWSFLLKDYQKRRVETFLNPENDLQGAGYHSSQSMIAIGSGQATGKGLGGGTQTQLSFLPENHTDFVFSVLAEEWGFVGGTFVIALFMLLIALIFREATKATDRFAALINVGAAAMIFLHVIINIGMVTGLLPVVGVTLPFMSYGGSSMVTQIVAVALVVNTSLHRRT